MRFAPGRQCSCKLCSLPSNKTTASAGGAAPSVGAGSLDTLQTASTRSMNQTSRRRLPHDWARLGSNLRRADTFIDDISNSPSPSAISCTLCWAQRIRLEWQNRGPPWPLQDCRRSARKENMQGSCEIQKRRPKAGGARQHRLDRNGGRKAGKSSAEVADSSVPSRRSEPF